MTFDEDTETEWRIDATVNIPIFSPITRCRRVCALESRQYRDQLARMEDAVRAEVDNATVPCRGDKGRRSTGDRGKAPGPGDEDHPRFHTGRDRSG